MVKQEQHSNKLNKFFFFQIISLLALLGYLVINKPDGQYGMKAEKVKIDSIVVRQRTSVLPDKIWVHYTKYGASLITTKEKYVVGDSIEIKIININEQ